MNKDKILGMILSGGLSRRMGSDKTFKKISGVNLIQHTIERSTKQVGRLIVNSNDSSKIFKYLNSTNYNLNHVLPTLYQTKFLQEDQNFLEYNPLQLYVNDGIIILISELI